MDRLEFYKTYMKQNRDLQEPGKLALTALLGEARKDAKIEGFRIALNLYNKNPDVFKEVITSLIEAKPPHGSEEAWRP